MKNQSVYFLCSLIMSFMIPVQGWAQSQRVDPPLDLSEATPVGTVSNFNVTDGVIEALAIFGYDLDQTNEGQLFVNGQGPIQLFPGASGANDGDMATINIVLTDQQKSWFQASNNTLEFRWTSTQGYRVHEVTAIGEVTTKAYEAVMPLDDEITPQRTRAHQIYKRLVGVNVPIDHPVVRAMEDAINSGDPLAAAELATNEQGFYNHVVRDMAAKMSTREETVKTQFNDFIATFIGVTRDELDARLLLTGNLFYMGSSNAPVSNDMIDDILRSNRHYELLEEGNYDYAAVLGRQDQQYLRGPNDSLVEHPDPAGVITSRAFMEAHASAGTNRRLVEFTMRQFTCNPIENWADSTSPDSRVGRDIDRYPGGDGARFQTTCKSCHGNMDGFRGAFAKFDFSDNFTKYANLYENGGGRDRMRQMPMGISRKLNHNEDTFRQGHETLDDSWVNYARSPQNMELLGWRGSVAGGNGVNQLAEAVANSRAFSQCMVKRVYFELCRREVAPFELPMVEQVANEFESEGYNLKSLFEKIAISNECIGR